MVTFDYDNILEWRIPPSVSEKMIRIHVAQERLRLWKQQYPDAFEELEKMTHPDAVFYSNACERIIDNKDEALGYISGEILPHDNTGLKIIGYSDARKYILSEAEKGTQLSPELLFETNRILIEKFKGTEVDYRREDGPHRGKGVMSVVRHVANSNDIEALTEELCTSVEISIYNETQPLLLIPAFACDFQYLSPMIHGNGRMSRLLTEYLLVRTGFDMVRYQPLDRFTYTDLRRYVSSIYKTSSQRAVVPRESMPFTEIILDHLDCMSTNLNIMFPPPMAKKYSKSERVRYVASGQKKKFTKNDIAPLLPGVSLTLIQQSLSDMVSENVLSRSGHTKGCKYDFLR